MKQKLCERIKTKTHLTNCRLRLIINTVDRQYADCYQRETEYYRPTASHQVAASAWWGVEFLSGGKGMDIVLWFLAGVAVACKKMGFDCIGSEISEKQVRFAAERISLIGGELR